MKKYFYSDGNEKHGPYSFEELKQEPITQETLIWHEGLDNWTSVKNVIEIKPILELIPPEIELNEVLDTTTISDKNPGIGLNEKMNDNEQGKGDEDPLKEALEYKKKHGLGELGVKKASLGWVIVGFILSLLGGWGGLAIGAYYAFGNYTLKDKKNGWTMIILAAIMIAAAMYNVKMR